jgi:uncharacterized protein YjbJ (UPF0337 family)
MNEDRTDGAGHKLAGAIKEGVGKLTGDTKLNAEGKVEHAAGSVQNTAGKVEDEPHHGVDHDRIEGAGKKLGGSIKEGVGKLTGDSKLEAEGKAQKAAGTVQNAIGGAKDTVRDAFKK